MAKLNIDSSGAVEEIKNLIDQLKALDRKIAGTSKTNATAFGALSEAINSLSKVVTTLNTSMGKLTQGNG